MVAFDMAYRWLRENAEQMLTTPTFVAAVLKMEIGEFCETFTDYVWFLCDGKPTEEASELLRPLFEAVSIRVRFLNEVFDDVADGGILPEDLLPLFGPLKVMGSVKIGALPIEEELLKLRQYCENEEVLARVQLPEMKSLVDLISVLVN
jgi:hypothetical protein